MANKGYNHRLYRDDAIEIAKELMYSKSVIEKLEKATTDVEISRIMTDARANEFDKVSIYDNLK